MNFMPDVGAIERMLLPERNRETRVDTGFRAGDDITSHYDSMIAKVIVHGPTRQAAIIGLNDALYDFHIDGPKTNIRFLRRIAGHPAFQEEDLFTGFIDKYIY
jgi:3-methylcrotonyl-CoA carboxylase alpha subunit